MISGLPVTMSHFTTQISNMPHNVSYFPSYILSYLGRYPVTAGVSTFHTTWKQYNTNCPECKGNPNYYYQGLGPKESCKICFSNRN
jgi:hypothetical protein